MWPQCDITHSDLQAFTPWSQCVCVEALIVPYSVWFSGFRQWSNTLSQSLSHSVSIDLFHSLLVLTDSFTVCLQISISHANLLNFPQCPPMQLWHFLTKSQLWKGLRGTKWNMMEYGIDKLAVPSVMTLLLHSCWNFKAIAGSIAKPNSLGCCMNTWPSSCPCSPPVVL